MAVFHFKEENKIVKTILLLVSLCIYAISTILFFVIVFLDIPRIVVGVLFITMLISQIISGVTAISIKKDDRNKDGR